MVRAMANIQLRGVVCVAGGFAGGSVNAKSFMKSFDLSIQQSLWVLVYFGLLLDLFWYYKSTKNQIKTSTIAARVAHKFLGPEGVLILTGSAGALEPNPKAVGYAAAKQAVHSMTASLAHPVSEFYKCIMIHESYCMI